jgi:hypothetical protein
MENNVKSQMDIPGDIVQWRGKFEWPLGFMRCIQHADTWGYGETEMT